MASQIISTQYGNVSGVPSDTSGVILFKGIPIGADTAGENRFRVPSSPACWDGCRVCETWPDSFLQMGNPENSFWYQEFYSDRNFTPATSENGLAVNIYAPESTREGLPVFVYIHGGGFVNGYASEEEFNASRLAGQDVIVVLLQYRLGALGWLALPGLSAGSRTGTSGNWAVLDLIWGLEWIRSNIGNFGGDPEKVTIGGQSAGAGMVTCLLRSPLARGLFRNAIVQSGFEGFLSTSSSLNQYIPLPEAEEKNAAALKEIFGRDITPTELRAIPTQDFLKPGPCPKNDMTGRPMNLLQQLNQATCRQVIDGYVFTEDSIDLLKPGALDGIQIMMGGCANEATSLFGDFVSMMGITPDNIADKIDSQYGAGFSTRYETDTKELAEFAFMRAMSDYSMQAYLESARLTASNIDHSTFVYHFRQAPPGRREAFYGAYHSSELWYMFHSMRQKPSQRSWRPTDYQMADLMSDYWLNFVKYGNPNREGMLLEWPPCTEENGFAYAVFEGGNVVISDGFH